MNLTLFYIFLFFRTSSFTLQALYNRIQSSFEKETKPCLLLIDDLSSLLSVGVHVQQVIDFSHYCSSLMCYSPTLV